MGTVINGTFFVPALNGSLVDINDCTNSICPLMFGQVRYDPSLPGNAVYLGAMIVLAMLHTFLGIRYRTWGFLAGVSLGLLLEIIGYLGRIGLHFNDFSFTYFVASFCCLAIAPALISASIYLFISRYATACGPDIARFRPKHYTAWFIGCDLISLVLQAAGGAMAAIGSGGSTEQNTGVDIMIAGMAWQVFSLLCCLVVALDLVFAGHRAHRAMSESLGSYLRHFPWAIVSATSFIFVRCCFRVAELKSGFGGDLANNQGLFMIFEGPMIIIAVCILAVFHPGRCFVGVQRWGGTSGDEQDSFEAKN